MRCVCGVCGVDVCVWCGCVFVVWCGVCVKNLVTCVLKLTIFLNHIPYNTGIRGYNKR